MEESNDISTDYATASFVFSTPQPTNALQFHGLGKVFLTISADGVMTIGEGMSADEATQEVAQMLIKHFAMAYVTEIAELHAEINRLKAKRPPQDVDA